MPLASFTLGCGYAGGGEEENWESLSRGKRLALDSAAASYDGITEDKPVLALFWHSFPNKVKSLPSSPLPFST